MDEQIYVNFVQVAMFSIAVFGFAGKCSQTYSQLSVWKQNSSENTNANVLYFYFCISVRIFFIYAFLWGFSCQAEDDGDVTVGKRRSRSLSGNCQTHLLLPISGIFLLFGRILTPYSSRAMVIYPTLRIALSVRDKISAASYIVNVCTMRLIVGHTAWAPEGCEG